MFKLKVFRCIKPYHGFTVGVIYSTASKYIKDDSGYERQFIDVYTHPYFEVCTFQMYLEQAEQL